MATVAELIEHLKTFPQDAIVEVKNEHTDRWDTIVCFGSVDLSETYVLDYTKDEDADLCGKIFVQLNSY